MALAKTREYNIKFTERGARQLDQATKRIDGNFSKLTSSLKNYAKLAAGAFSLTAIYQGITKVTTMAIEQEQIFKNLQTAINLTGRNYDDLSKQLNNTFAELQRFTQYGDTDSAKVLTTLVQLTGNYDKAIKALPVTLDLAASGLFDVSTSARYVSMAIEGNIDMLGRYIPELRTNSNELLKNATSAEKAEYAFKLLNEKFGGTAQRNVETTRGAFSQLTNEIGDTAEWIGDRLTPSITKTTQELTKLFRGINSFLNSDTAQGFVKWVGNAIDSFDKWSKIIFPFRNAVDYLRESIIGFADATEDSTYKGNANRGMLELNVFAVDKLSEKMKKAKKEQAEFAEGMERIRKEIARLPKTLEFTTFQQDKLNAKQREQMGILQEVAGAYDGFSISLSNLIIETSAGWDYAREKFMQFGDSMSSVFKRNLKEGENLFSGLLDSFTDMLAQMVAELLARAAIFGLLSLFGIPMGGASLGSFVLGGVSSTGGLQAATGGGIQPPASVPNSPMRGGGQTNITVNTIDAASFESFLRYRNGAQIISRTLPEVLG